MPQEKINVLIVEDESIVALNLSMGLENDGYNIVGIADNAVDARQLFSENEVDIILMDINIIGDKDGIQTAEELLQQKQLPVIYLTALTDSQTINRVKGTHPAAFLTKPYDINNVRIAIELALNNFAVARSSEATKVVPLDKNTAAPETNTDKEVLLQMNDSVFVKNNYRFVKMKLTDILYAEADNNYINLVTAESKTTLRLSLNQFMEKIRYASLLRIHRSFAVNIDAITSFNEQQVMIDKYELPIGRNYREDFLKHFYFK
jgi:DNA-binding LytR/AlgR family response regulator